MLSTFRLPLCKGFYSLLLGRAPTPTGNPGAQEPKSRSEHLGDPDHGACKTEAQPLVEGDHKPRKPHSADLQGVDGHIDSKQRVQGRRLRAEGHWQDHVTHRGVLGRQRHRISDSAPDPGPLTGDRQNQPFLETSIVQERQQLDPGPVAQEPSTQKVLNEEVAGDRPGQNPMSSAVRPLLSPDHLPAQLQVPVALP
ncbi:hypothetical protein CB1_000249017 [Camelus ferus]|nr:hypothetical protein CB1_000249017 [Camelus ferus]